MSLLTAWRRRLALAICPDLAARPKVDVIGWDMAAPPAPPAAAPKVDVSEPRAPAQPALAVGGAQARDAHRALVALAEAYATHRGLTLSTVSTYAAEDGKFFGSLKTGAGCTLRRANRILAWFSAHWPEDLAWPSDVPRPAVDRAADLKEGA